MKLTLYGLVLVGSHVYNGNGESEVSSMWKISIASGLGLLIFSGVLFTAERFIAIIHWIGMSAPVKMNGNGTYPADPTMPGLLDNLFVPLFLIIGLLLLVIGVLAGFRQSR